jgi:hypothetical protein
MKLQGDCVFLSYALCSTQSCDFCVCVVYDSTPVELQMFISYQKHCGTLSYLPIVVRFPCCESLNKTAPGIVFNKYNRTF